MTLVRWKPRNRMFSELEPWDNLMNEFLARPWDSEVIQKVWSPRVDIIETEQEVRVMADLPGLKKEDVEITLENGILTISGERRTEEEHEGERLQFSERACGKFTRRFTLRESIDTSRIDATFKDGVLTIHLPKIEQARPKRIKIKAE